MSKKRKNEDIEDIKALNIDGVKIFLSKVIKSILEADFVKNLEAHKIDGEALLLLSIEHLAKLGLSKLGDQLKVEDAIKKYNEDNTPTKKSRTEANNFFVASSSQSSSSSSQIKKPIQADSDSDDSFENPNYKKPFKRILNANQRKSNTKKQPIHKEDDIESDYEKMFTYSAQPQKDIKTIKGIIENVNNAFINDNNEIHEIPRFLNEINQINLILPETVIAVIGTTGTGKSSLINALLGVDKLLPTSAIQACTATIIEVRYKNIDNYEADIEFISEEEWNKELSLLLNDIASTKKKNVKTGSPVAVAKQKVKAVYGKIATPSQLKAIRDLSEYLGKIKKICDENHRK